MTTYLQRAADEITYLLRKFDVHQPRVPGGENGGQWVKNPASAAKAVAAKVGDVLSDAELDRHHGVALKSYNFSGSPKRDGSLQVVAREGGKLTVQSRAGGGKHRLFAAVGADDARDWDDLIVSVTSGPDGFGGKPGPNGLVSWKSTSGLLVGRDEKANVVVRFTGDADKAKLKQSIDGFDGFELDDYSADEFAQGLRDMADAAEG